MPRKSEHGSDALMPATVGHTLPRASSLHMLHTFWSVLNSSRWHWRRDVSRLHTRTIVSTPDVPEALRPKHLEHNAIAHPSSSCPTRFGL